jgi:hypothetical protein
MFLKVLSEKLPDSGRVNWSAQGTAGVVLPGIALGELWEPFRELFELGRVAGRELR